MSWLKLQNWIREKIRETPQEGIQYNEGYAYAMFQVLSQMDKMEIEEKKDDHKN